LHNVIIRGGGKKDGGGWGGGGGGGKAKFVREEEKVLPIQQKEKKKKHDRNRKRACNSTHIVFGEEDNIGSTKGQEAIWHHKKENPPLQHSIYRGFYYHGGEVSIINPHLIVGIRKGEKRGR